MTEIFVGKNTGAEPLCVGIHLYIVNMFEINCKHIVMADLTWWCIFTGHIIWFSIKKEFFSLERDIFFCLCYQIPAYSSHQAYLERDMYDIIVEDKAIYEEKYECDFIVCGDLNGRAGIEADYVTDDNYAYLPLPKDYVADIPYVINRNNEDRTVNMSGRRILDICKMSNLRIANGRIGKDASKGSVTCVKSRGSSTVDYVLCTPVLLNILNDFEVYPVNEYSDHNPIVFDLKVHCCQSAMVTDIARQKMIWD